MEIKIENLKKFLEKNNYNWQGFACREDDYSRTLREYRFDIAKNFDKNILCDDYLNTRVFLYFGLTPSDATRTFISENDQNVVMCQITNYRFIVYKKEKNTESCGFGDFEYVPFIWKKEKDLSREWIKHLVKTVPNYKQQILKQIENKKQTATNDLVYKLKDIDARMQRLTDEQNFAMQNNKKQMKELTKLEKYINKSNSEEKSL